tara:strand:- start:11115 stop:11474 length:360 start_codon:yes stop_codon:yes gene_type:complete
MNFKIRLKKINLFGYHGVHCEEIKNGQKFEIDIELTANSKQAIELDDIAYAVDYSKVYKQVIDTFRSNRYNLIETLASDISNAILHNFSVLSCKIIICKPNAPLEGEFDTVEVEYLQNA